MNIFVLDSDPKKCAEYHCDKHVVKMILEYAQLLSTARVMYGEEAPYKPTHVNHPCAKWARASKANYAWLYTLMYWLNQEYHHRFPKNRNHLAFEKMIRFVSPPARMPGIHLTDFPQCMKDEYKGRSAITAYRSYYNHDKRRFARWTARDAPVWFSSFNLNGE